MLKKDCIINDNFIKLFKKFSPGPITFVLKLKKDSKISKYILSKQKNLAIRFPKHMMFKNLLDVLLGSEEDKLNDEDEKIALAALCVRVAKSDNVYDQSEISSIDAELSQHFSISVDDAAALRLQAEELENDAPDTVRFTRAIKEKIE